MDLIKIGKFIANCRKDKNLTQEQLAEKLYVTDRAVSKWERGLSLPDAGKMLDLCGILDIKVNELLTGEKIDMENMNKKSEELLVEMARQEQIKNKKLLTSMYVMVASAIFFYIGIILLACVTLKQGNEQRLKQLSPSSCIPQDKGLFFYCTMSPAASIT